MQESISHLTLLPLKAYHIAKCPTNDSGNPNDSNTTTNHNNALSTTQSHHPKINKAPYI